MTALDALLYDIAFWHWLALAAGLLVIEIAAPGAVFLWISAAAGATGLLSLAVGEPMTPTLQIAFFAIAAVVSVPLGRRLFPQRKDGHDAADGLNQRGQSMIGSVGRLESDTADGLGRAKIGDTVWSVRIADGGDLAADAPIVVTQAEGARLVAAPRLNEQQGD